MQPIQYKNRKKQTYYLLQSVTKTGNPKYFFSMNGTGALADNVPDGFEILYSINLKQSLASNLINNWSSLC